MKTSGRKATKMVAPGEKNLFPASLFRKRDNVGVGKGQYLFRRRTRKYAQNGIAGANFIKKLSEEINKK